MEKNKMKKIIMLSVIFVLLVISSYLVYALAKGVGDCPIWHDNCYDTISEQNFCSGSYSSGSCLGYPSGTGNGNKCWCEKGHMECCDDSDSGYRTCFRPIYDGFCCVDSSWTPDTSTECEGQNFTQTSNCGNTRTATGTLQPNCAGRECGQAPNGCGSCGSCSNPHGTTSCSSGQCNPICSFGWGNCDGNDKNGCETDLTTTSNCGGCGNICEGDDICVDGNCEPPPNQVTTATFESRINDTGGAANYTNATWTSFEETGVTWVAVKARTGNTEAELNSRDWSTCPYIANGNTIVGGLEYSESYTSYPIGWTYEVYEWWYSFGNGWVWRSETNNCVDNLDRYVQYMVELNTNDIAKTPIFYGMSIDYEICP